MLTYPVLLFFPFLMAYAAASDFLTMTIANWISITLWVGFIVFAVVFGLSWQEIVFHMACGFGVLVVTFIMFTLGWIGGGDAKLASSAALWLGLPLLLEFFAVTSIFGGLLTLFIIVFRQFPLPQWIWRQQWAQLMHTHGNGVPYGIALCAAGLLLYPECDVFQVFNI